MSGKTSIFSICGLLFATVLAFRAQGEDPLDIWTVHHQTPGTALMDITTSESGFLITGYTLIFANPPDVGFSELNHFIRRSSNGVDWVEYTLPRLPNNYVWGPNTIAEGNGMILVAGGFGRIMTSSNGMDWTERYVSASHRLTYQSAVFGNGQFAIGGGINTPVSYLPAGMISSGWPELTFSPSDLGSIVAFGETKFIVGGNQKVGVSVDGKTWEYFAVPDRVIALGYANGIFLMAGNDNSGANRSEPYSIYTSSDGGQNWVKRYSGANPIRSFTFGDGRFLAAGDKGTVLTSLDGITWTKRSIPSKIANKIDINHAAYSNGIFLLMSRELILRSVDRNLADNHGMLIAPEITPQGLQFTAWPPTNGVAQLQTSTDLRLWTDVNLSANLNPYPTKVMDNTITNAAPRFYRIIAK